MKTILFMIDMEEGHIYPTFPLAKSLKNKFRILYSGPPDSQQIIVDHGFEYKPIFEKVYPKGFKREYKTKTEDSLNRGLDSHFYLFRQGSEIQLLLESYSPQVIIVSSFFSIEALLLYYHFGIKPIIFSPRVYDFESELLELTASEMLLLEPSTSITLIDSVRKMGVKIKSLYHFTKPLEDFYHFIASIPEFESERINYNNKTFYIGGGISVEERIVCTEDKKTKIYVSMGSQSHLYKKKILKLIEIISEVAKLSQFKTADFIVTTGTQEPDKINVKHMSENVEIHAWVDQKKILADADLAIIHGGFNSIKECIYSIVPMLIIPGDRDQPANAERVKHNQIGEVINNILELSPAELARIITNLLSNKVIRTNLKRIRKSFLLLDEQERAIKIVESLAADSIH